MKERYIEVIANSIGISIDDLTETELSIINHCYNIFKDRLKDIKTLEDEVKRLSIENANLKAYNDDSDF